MEKARTSQSSQSDIQFPSFSFSIFESQRTVIDLKCVQCSAPTIERCQSCQKLFCSKTCSVRGYERHASCFKILALHSTEMNNPKAVQTIESAMKSLKLANNNTVPKEQFRRKQSSGSISSHSQSFEVNQRRDFVNQPRISVSQRNQSVENQIRFQNRKTNNYAPNQSDRSQRNAENFVRSRQIQRD